jgi:hypothetical protein
MIVLDATTKSLQILLAGAVTTNQLAFTASYADYIASPAAFTPGANDGQTNGATAVTLVAAPAASTQRQVKRINVYNNDTAPATVTIRLNNGGTLRTQLTVTLQTGERIEYEDAEGFRVFTVTGAVKVTAVQSTVEPGYIDGLKLRRVSATAITVTSGSAYIPSVGANVNVNADIAKVGLSLTPSAFSHVYLFLNAGVPDIEIVATAPSSPYNGTARTKTGDTTRRYLGSVLTDGSSNIYSFLHDGQDIAYQVNVFPAPFQVLANGNASVATSVSCSGVVPTTARMVSAIISNGDTTVRMDVWNSDGALAMMFVNGNNSNFARIPLNASQQLIYAFVSAPTGVGNIRINGYQLER